MIFWEATTPDTTVQVESANVQFVEAVDADGNVYAAEGPNSREAAGGGITKYVAVVN